jgi:hypothetical protein
VSGYPAMAHEKSVDVFMFLSRHKRLLRDIDDLKKRVAATDHVKSEK